MKIKQPVTEWWMVQRRNQEINKLPKLMKVKHTKTFTKHWKQSYPGNFYLYLLTLKKLESVQKWLKIQNGWKQEQMKSKPSEKQGTTKLGTEINEIETKKAIQNREM